MWAVGARKKKLILAFHFLRTNQAAWKCGTCRVSGLERARNCGWLRRAEGPDRIVWSSGAVSTRECPKSAITTSSAAWVEDFLVWDAVGGVVDDSWLARRVDAFLVLKSESLKGEANG